MHVGYPPYTTYLLLTILPLRQGTQAADRSNSLEFLSHVSYKEGGNLKGEAKSKMDRYG